MDDKRDLEPGWNGELGAPKEAPPENVVTTTVNGKEEPVWHDGPNGPEWVTSDK